MDKQLISIITPVYNAEAYIEDTIKSIECQTYKNYEAIFVDDCSTDNSVKIIEKYAVNNERIKIIKLKRNKGVAFARNIGIRKAKGKYLCFLDSDDIWKKNKLEEQLNFIKQNNCAFTYTAFKYMNNEGTRVGKKINVIPNLDYNKALLDMRIILSTVMINLNVMPKRYCFMPNIMHEDAATWWKILKKGYVAHGQNEVLVYYRKAKKSRSSNKVNSAYYRWKLYRKIEKLSLIKSIYCFCHYAINAIIKRIGKLNEPLAQNELKMQVLLSTMNLKTDNDVEKIVKEMKISSDYLIVNQTLDKDVKISNKKVVTKFEKGLSKSRNVAIENAKEDIILFADDDVVYANNYETTIIDAYNKYPAADIICFYVESLNKKRKTKRIKTGKIGYIKSMRVVSFEISCRRKSLIANNIKFDENFGIGAKNNRGEEQILLYEALKKGLNVIFVNEKIGEAKQEESNWFLKYDKQFFEIQGRVFKRLTKRYYLLLILQYAIRKYPLYKKDINFIHAMQSMLRGSKNI